MILFPLKNINCPIQYDSLKLFLFVVLADLLLIVNPLLGAQQPPSKPPHYRGLCITPNNTLWVSGTKGTVLLGKTTNNNSFQFDTCKTGFYNKDFRDIWALDENIAVAMSIADSAVVIKTTDGGKTWRTVYTDETPGIFLDVIEIDPKTGVGIILGDPLLDNSKIISEQSNPVKTITQKHFKALLTVDFGNSWIDIPAGEWNLPVDTLESFFAASGTSLNIITSKANHKTKKYAFTAGFAGGGHDPKYHLVEIKRQIPRVDNKDLPFSKNEKTNPNYSWKINPLPNLDLGFKGGPAWGCYGLAHYQFSKGIAVGGNYAQPNFRGDTTGAIAAYSTNILTSWQPAVAPPFGYRSGVCISATINKDTVFKLFFQDTRNLCEGFFTAHGETPSQFFFKTNRRKEIPISICTGTNGTDISFDGGVHWLQLSQERGFNACSWTCNNLILVGNQGKIRAFTLEELAKNFRDLNPLSPYR
jgi:hypothetical protein